MNAQTRGEERQAPGAKPIEDNRGTESVEEDCEEDECKENNPSLSPSPVPTPTTARRPTILGKRPLSDLPTPEEPESDDESDIPMTSSERNIVANTPNLSSNLECMSFNSTTTQSSHASIEQQPRRPTKLAERSRGVNFIRPRTDHTFQDAPASCSLHEPEQVAPPSAKRVCSGSGDKENAMDLEEAAKAVFVSAKPAALVGLGLKTAPSSAASSRKSSTASGGSAGARNKPRVGLRRL